MFSELGLNGHLFFYNENCMLWFLVSNHSILTAQISVKLPAYFTENKIRIRTRVTTSTSPRVRYVCLVENNHRPRSPHLHHKKKLYWTSVKSLLLLAMFTSLPQRRKEIRTEPEQFTDLGNDQWEIFEPPPGLQARFSQVTK